MFRKFITTYQVLHRYINFIQQKCLPACCLLCGNFAEHDSQLCYPCQKDLPILSHPCYQCAKILPDFAMPTLCGTCLKEAPPFELTHSLFAYEWPITDLIIQLKFHQKLHLARFFGELIAHKILSDWYKNQILPDLIIPVPLHLQRLKERGFNQALEIAKFISRRLACPLDRSAMKSIRPTLAQSHFSPKNRKHNIIKTFL